MCNCHNIQGKLAKICSVAHISASSACQDVFDWGQPSRAPLLLRSEGQRRQGCDGIRRQGLRSGPRISGFKINKLSETPETPAYFCDISHVLPFFRIFLTRSRSTCSPLSSPWSRASPPSLHQDTSPSSPKTDLSLPFNIHLI